MGWLSFFNIAAYFSWLASPSKGPTILNLNGTLNDSIRSIVNEYRKGDIVNKFKLESKLEHLGLPTYYTRGDTWRITASKDVNASTAPLVDDHTGNKTVIRLDDEDIYFNSQCIRNGSFCINENIFNGGHGEIWRAYKIIEDVHTTTDFSPNNSTGVNRTVSYVLKRMHVKDKPAIRQCAIREIFFGELLSKLAQRQEQVLFARYISYFVSPDEEDYWLVFRDEGFSLQQSMYATVYSQQNALLKPSELWRKLRTTARGETTFKGILYQLILAVGQLHAMNITHRDLKPSNILLNVDDRRQPRILVADFSSAVGPDVGLLYGPSGPSTAEETLLYAPPEVLLADRNGEDVPYFAAAPATYDLWSLGVIYLELLLGTADVFTLDERSVNIITQKMRKKGITDANQIKRSILLAVFSEYCIYNPPEETSESRPTNGTDPNTQVAVREQQQSQEQSQEQSSQEQCSESNSSLALSNATKPAEPLLHPTSPNLPAIEYTPLGKKPTCGLNGLSTAILKRDPLGKGFNSYWGLDLLSRLLAFDPTQRISAADALLHAYFTGPYVSSFDNSEHATKAQLEAHDRELAGEPEWLNNGSGGGGSVEFDFESLFEEEEEEDVIDVSAEAGEAVTPPLFAEYPILLEEAELSGDTVLDRRIFNNQHAIVSGILGRLDFVCPHCHRTFPGDYPACLKHATTRRHGLHCLYDPSSLPACLSEHALQPLDPQSGWCDLQGTRQYIEDVHAMYYDDHFQFFGVFDGHFGANAAKFASKHIYGLFHQFVWNAAQNVTGALEYGAREVKNRLLEQRREYSSEELVERQHSLLGAIAADADGRGVMEFATSEAVVLPNTSVTAGQLLTFISDAFVLTDNQLMHRSYHGMELTGGTTATTLILIGDYLLIAHVGDSRVVACCEQTSALRPLQLTLDHTPYSRAERQRVLDRGGWIDSNGTVLRVNGQLAVTRSLGDPALRHYLSATPDVLMFKYRFPRGQLPVVDSKPTSAGAAGGGGGGEVGMHCAAYHRLVQTHYPTSSGLCFVIIGSDGLWDVVNNLEASEFVCEYLNSRISEASEEAKAAAAAALGVETATTESSFLPVDAMHEVSKLLAYEALVRGSSDNIGVSVIDLLAGVNVV